MTDAVVYLLDDEAGMVKALTRLLRLEGLAVEGYTSAVRFMKAFQPERVSCLVLDVAMPELNGLELQECLAQGGIPLPVIFLSGHADIPMTVRAVKAGAVDFLTKPVNDADLLRAVRSALAVAAKRWTELRAVAGLKERYADLTPREREVMTHVVRGQLNKQIAADLGTGEQNIKIHRGRVMQKMGVPSVADLVRVADRLQL